MQTKPRIIGNHAYFFREGKDFTVPAAGTASRTSKPGADNGWADFGVINNVDVTADGDDKEIYTPSPGQLRLYDVLRTKRKLTIKFECEELQLMSFELAFGSQALEADEDAIQYNPLKGGEIKGWLKVEQYDQNDQLVNTVDVYVYLKPSGAMSFNDDVAKTSMEALVLHSNLNSGEIAAEA